MKILDYRDQNDFNHACNELASKVNSSGVSYDLIVGIATGGEITANIMKEIISHDSYLVVKRQRRSTEVKEKSHLIKIFVRLLPVFIQNFVRRVEWLVAETKFNRKLVKRESNELIVIKEPTNNRMSYHSVLIIDDCVDSGNTILDVKDYVMKKYSPSVLDIAALTVSHKAPLIKPSYYLHDRATPKCPWSLDSLK